MSQYDVDHPVRHRRQLVPAPSGDLVGGHSRRTTRWRTSGRVGPGWRRADDGRRLPELPGLPGASELRAQPPRRSAAGHDARLRRPGRVPAGCAVASWSTPGTRSVRRGRRAAGRARPARLQQSSPSRRPSSWPRSATTPSSRRQEVGEGRSLVWTSDIGPHWCPEEFLRWEGFETVVGAMLSLARPEESSHAEPQLAAADRPGLRSRARRRHGDPPGGALARDRPARHHHDVRELQPSRTPPATRYGCSPSRASRRPGRGRAPPVR